MVFSSITFLFYFLPIVLILYYIAPNKLKNLVLFLASLLFYFFGEPKYIWLMLFSVTSIYIHGILIDKYKNTKYAKMFLISGITISLALLGYFKYIDFLIENINLFLQHKIDAIGVILPIGISFYTFQMISYIIDVYKKEAKVQKSFLKLATYVTLFPQLIAGPIVRYTTIEEQLEKRTHTFEKFSNGVRRFIIGLSKKVLIANILGEFINIYGSLEEKTVLLNWLYGITNMLQIYFDFSGYSDMAIGLGKMFGFEFLENFNYPYIATSITDFWRRWHISLSTWFRDYVYIPLGGNRVKKIKWFRNILIVWFLTGLWHGANWNFILWGIYFGGILIIEKVFLLKYLEKTPKIINRTYSLFIVMISFIIFSGNNLSEIGNSIKGLFPIDIAITSNVSIYYLKSYFIVLIVAIIGATPLIKNIIEKLITNKNQEINIKTTKKIINILEPIILMILFIVSVSFIVDGSFNPFLYFRF